MELLLGQCPNVAAERGWSPIRSGWTVRVCLQVRIIRAPIQGLKFKSAPGYHSHHLKPQFKKRSWCIRLCFQAIPQLSSGDWLDSPPALVSGRAGHGALDRCCPRNFFQAGVFTLLLTWRNELP